MTQTRMMAKTIMMTPSEKIPPRAIFCRRLIFTFHSRLIGNSMTVIIVSYSYSIHQGATPTHRVRQYVYDGAVAEADQCSLDVGLRIAITYLRSKRAQHGHLRRCSPATKELHAIG